jgi:hypothetical protein
MNTKLRIKLSILVSVILTTLMIFCGQSISSDKIESGSGIDLGHGISVEKVLEIRAKLGPTEDMGKGVDGHRRNYPIIGGNFEGKGLKGVVVPGGADFSLERIDGAELLHAFYRIKTDDGQIIIVDNKGIFRLTEEGKTKKASGKEPLPSDFYCMTTPTFLTPPGKYAWLQDYIFFGTVGDTGSADEVLVEIYKLDQKIKID